MVRRDGMQRRLLKLREAAELLAISPRTLGRLVDQGQISAVSVGCGKIRRSLRLEYDELRKFMNSRKVERLNDVGRLRMKTIVQSSGLSGGIRERLAHLRQAKAQNRGKNVNVP